MALGNKLNKQKVCDYIRKQKSTKKKLNLIKCKRISNDT